MSVNGEVHIPHEMNFLFPLSLTTPDGFTMKLLFGQSSVSQGLKAKLDDLYDAGKDAAKTYAAAETGKDFSAMKHVVQYDHSLLKVFDKVQLWNLTAIGSWEYPCILFDYGPGHQINTRILDDGPACS